MITTDNNIFELLFSFNDRIIGENHRIIEESVLEEQVERVLSKGDYSFETGLLGIAWLISYLFDSKFLIGDPDEVLSDFDDLIYKLTLKEIVQDEINIDNHLYFVTYYQQRLINASKGDIYRRFTHFESLKLLIDRLNKYLDTLPFDNYKDANSAVLILLKYSYLAKYTIDESLFEKPFYKTIETIIDGIVEKELSITQENIAKLFVCVKQYSNKYWADKLVGVIKADLESNNFWSIISKELISRDLNDINLVPHLKNNQNIRDFFDFSTNFRLILS